MNNMNNVNTKLDAEVPTGEFQGRIVHMNQRNVQYGDLLVHMMIADQYGNSIIVKAYAVSNGLKHFYAAITPNTPVDVKFRRNSYTSKVDGQVHHNKEVYFIKRLN